jgi:molecular chaperone GrpE
MTKEKKKKQTNKNRIAELENNWKRALADYQNLQKRFAEEKEDYVKRANGNLLARLLPILDNLELMQEHSKDKGLDMIIDDFRCMLEEECVEEIEVEERLFDAKEMEAVEKVSGERDLVIEVMRKGYKLKNIILRPARVKVGGKKEEK